ncbi:MAG: mannonate dehydratase [Actinobacteria bacterium 69-20]|jgi:mannonate dehydratase|nr:mannonate dehydratase [Actinomycetota bacterium]OJV24540.1 MAG: mannonate dehydratase [Actinobacteria bacterium 69-20]
MIQLCELLEAPPSDLWTLVNQCGVDGVVAILDGAEQQGRWLRAAAHSGAAEPAADRGGPAPWSYESLADMVALYARHGLRVAAIEDTPPMDAIRMGLPDAPTRLAQVHEQIRAMGRLGIPVLCYNWMAASSWARTDTAIPTRGGALTTGFKSADAEQLPALLPPGALTEETLWSTLHEFLAATLPVAEEAGVMLSLHPDDPPLPSTRGVPRIVRSLDAYRTIMRDHPSPANRITFCQGNFRLMTSDLPATIDEFLPHIAFVHLRDVEGTVEDFTETFHDQGPTDLAECVRRYVAGGFSGPMRPDHVPTLCGESNAKPGYATLGRLFAVGYVRGLIDAAVSIDQEGRKEPRS